ncbi:hypothetical protein PV341_42310 [Streptomyces sp. PA03-1a]|nr:hypothetical protein [Streptomyces sp. PA03-1a]
MTTQPAPLRLDPLGRDQHGENAALRALGPVARVELPGAVPAWAVTRHDLLQETAGGSAHGQGPPPLARPRRGRGPRGLAADHLRHMPGMMTSGGPDHRRLRGLVAQAFTPRRVAALRPRVEALAA